MSVEDQVGEIAEQVFRIAWWLMPRFTGGFATEQDTTIALWDDGAIRRDGAKDSTPTPGARKLAEARLSDRQYFIACCDFYCKVDSEEMTADLVRRMAWAASFELLSQVSADELQRKSAGTG